MATKTTKSVSYYDAVKGDTRFGFSGKGSTSGGSKISSSQGAGTYQSLQRIASGTPNATDVKAPSDIVARQATSAASAPIPMDNLGATQAIKMPTPSIDTTGATSLVAGADAASKSLNDYIKEITPPETEASKAQSDLLKQINTLLPDLANKSKDQLKAEQDAGLPDARKKLAAINSQLVNRVAEYNKAIAETELAPGETPLGLVMGRQAVLRRNEAADVGLLQARALGLQGEVEAAQEIANRAIDLKYDTIKSTLDIKMQQLQLIQPILDKEERIYARALERQYTDQREALAEKKATAKANVALALEAGLTTRYTNKNGEFFHTATGETFRTPEQFFAHAGVSSFEEAYSRGLIGDYSPDMAANRSIVADLISKYPDAGITLQDTPQTAGAKLGRSRIYGEQVRPPIGGGGGGGGGTKITGPNGEIIGLTNQQIDNISPILGRFKAEPAVQNFQTIAEGYNFVSSLQSGTANPVDDQALIYALAKALDPGSVVREGEYATAQRYAQSWAQAYGKGVEQAVAGTGFLSETARNNIKSTITSRYKAAEKTYNNLYGEYRSQVEQFGQLPAGTGNSLLTNYAGAVSNPSLTLVGPPAPTSSSVGSTTNTTTSNNNQGWWQKTTNWLFGD